MCNFIKKVPVFPKLEKKVADVTTGFWNKVDAVVTV